MSDEIEDEPTELAPRDVDGLNPTGEDLMGLQPTNEIGGAQISNLQTISESQLADLQFGIAKTLRPSEVSADDIREAQKKTNRLPKVQDRPTVEEKTKQHSTGDLSKPNIPKPHVEEKTKQHSTGDLSRPNIPRPHVEEKTKQHSTGDLSRPNIPKPHVEEKTKQHSTGDLPRPDLPDSTTTSAVSDDFKPTTEIGKSAIERAKAAAEASDLVASDLVASDLVASDPAASGDLDVTSLRRIDAFLARFDTSDIDETSLKRVIDSSTLESAGTSSSDAFPFDDVETSAVATQFKSPTHLIENSPPVSEDKTEFEPIKPAPPIEPQPDLDQTIMPTAIDIEHLLETFYPEDRQLVAPEASKIIRLSMESEAILEMASRGVSPEDEEDEDKDPFTLGELSAIGAGMSAAVIACVGFGILSAWPSALTMFVASLGIIVLFAGGVAYLAKSRFRAGVAIAPTVLAIAIVGAWAISDFRLAMLTQFPELFLDSSIEVAIRTEDGRIVTIGCEEMNGRMNGLNIIQDSIHARPDIAKICIKKVTDPQEQSRISGVLTNRWERELLSGEFESACRYVDHFEYLASIHENASLRLASIALRVESAKIRDCVLKHLKKKYPTPEAMVAEWSDELNDVSEATGRKFVEALIDSWRVEREDLKDTNFAPTATMMNFRLKLACSYIRDEGPSSDVIGWIPGILQQSDDGHCASAVTPEAIVETCEDYRGKTVKVFCDTLLADTLPFAMREASSLIHRAIRWGLDPDPFQGYERTPDAYRNGASEAIAAVRTSGASRLAKDELERQASEAFVYMNPDLSTLTTKIEDSKIDEGMALAFGSMQDKTPQEIAEQLGLNWDELSRADKLKLKALAEEVEMDPEKRKKIMKELKRAKRKKRRRRR